MPAKQNPSQSAERERQWRPLLAEALRGSLRRRGQLGRKCARKATARSVHELRVETRRLIGLVTIMGKASGSPTRKARRSLQRCLDDTGKLRDAQVHLRYLDGLLPDHPGLKRLRRHLRRILRHQIRATAKALKKRPRLAVKSLHALAKKQPAIPAQRSAAPAIIARTLRAAFVKAKALERAARRGGESLHRARLALKRLRYLAEALHGIFPGLTSAWLRQLRHRQSFMGEIHDLQLIGRRMEKYAARHPRRTRRVRRAREAVAERTRRMLQNYRPGVAKFAPGFLGK